MQPVRALFFDVFGTLVDWRGSVAREACELLSPRGVAIGWEAFADAWRDQYQPAMEEVRSGRLPFTKLDALHRRNLDVILDRFGLNRIDESTRVELNLAWHRLAGAPACRLPDRALLEREHFADGRPGAAQRPGLGRDRRR